MRDSPPINFGPVLDRLRPVARRGRDLAVALATRVSPLVVRANDVLRRNAKIAAGLDAITGAWDRLVDAFCETIDPYLARIVPDVRLVAIVDDADGLSLHRLRMGHAAEPLALDSSDVSTIAWTSVELRLRPDQVLTRTLALPASSRAFLAPIIEHRLERLTPWKPDQVLFGYRVIEPTDPSPTITIAIEATSRDIVAGPLARLRDLGLVPTVIGARSATITEPLGIVLQSGGGTLRRPASRRLVSRTAMATFAALSVFAIVATTYASVAEDARDQTAARLVKARRLLRNASLGAAGSPEQALLAAKRPDRAMIVVVDGLAAAIPQTTVLKELAITTDKVRLAGRSGDAAALVGHLEATGLVNVRFTAPVTREKDGTDSFELTAERPSVEVVKP